jgi:nitrite reductase/ring-hydroxylating ferredoxin subunit
MASFVKVATRSEIPDGSGKCVEVAGRRVALFNLDGTFFAIDDECTHSGGPLCEGTIEGEEIECPWHMGRFNIKTGAVVDPPPMDDLGTYNVRLSGEDLEVEI